MSFTLSSNAFVNADLIPRKYTADGVDVSPPLKWTKPPERTKSFALICDDPDAPVGTWVHWIIYGIDPGDRTLSEGVPTKDVLADGAIQGLNDFSKVGYGGPAPPRGPTHRYFFKLYALDIDSKLKPHSTKEELVNAMKGHILAEAELIGKYKR